MGGTGRSVTERVAMLQDNAQARDIRKGRLNMWLVWLRARYSHSYCPPPRLIHYAILDPAPKVLQLSQML